MDGVLGPRLGHRLTLGTRSAADIAEQPDVLRRVLPHNADALQRARGILGNKRVVRLIGIGSSKHAAGFGASALELLAGVPATVLAAPGIAVPLPPLDPSQPLVVISQSGRTPSVLDAVQRARSAHVDVIAITNEPESPLEDLATVVLRCHAGVERIVAATKSVTAQMCLLLALATEVDTNDLVRRVRSALDANISGMVGGDVPSAIVCGGFAASWIADEIAIKFTEMASLLMTSEDVIEHFHGPHAARASTLAFLDANDPNSSELARQHNVRTIAVGGSPLDAIATVALGQRVAHAWALERGDDPDADRGLQKVTRTR